MPNRQQELGDIRGRLQNVEQFDAQAATDVEKDMGKMPSLPGLPGFEDFEAGDIGTGIKIGRSLALLMAGLQDPSLANAMMQQFAAQDQLAKSEAYTRYQSALGQAQAQRENVEFQEKTRESRVGERQTGQQIQLRALEAAIRSLELEMMAEQGQGAAQQEKLNTLSELVKLRDEMAGQQFGGPAEAPQAESLIEAIVQGHIDPQRGSQLMTMQGEEGEVARQQALAEVNESLKAGFIPPKPIVSQEEFESLLSASSPLGQTFIRNAFAVAPDPRTGGFDNSGDAVAWSSNLSALAQEDPEAFEKSVEALATSLVASGSMRNMQEAEEAIADWISEAADPEEDPRLNPPGHYPPPEAPGQPKSESLFSKIGRKTIGVGEGKQEMLDAIESAGLDRKGAKAVRSAWFNGRDWKAVLEREKKKKLGVDTVTGGK